MKNVRVLCLWVLLLIVAVTGYDVYRWQLTSDTGQYAIGFRLHGADVMETITGIRATLVTQCAYSCIKTSTCQSYNHDNRSHVCELNTNAYSDVTSNASAKLVHDANFTYFSRNAYALEGFLNDAVENCENGGFLRYYVNDEGEMTSRCTCPRDWSGHRCNEPVEQYEWDPWSDWSTCSATCDPGMRHRNRTCSLVGGGHVMETYCNGRYREIEECQIDPCDDSMWLQWTPWSECSTARKCGPGIRERKRVCVRSKTNETSATCWGEGTEHTVCSSPSCDVPHMLTNGSVFGEGDVMIYDDVKRAWRPVCGDQWTIEEANVACRELGFIAGAYADSAKVDKINNPNDALTNVSCHGNEASLAACFHNPWYPETSGINCTNIANVQCNVHGAWGAWNTWSNCSVTCNDGIRLRHRPCDHPEPRHDGNDCPGNATQARLCQNPLCKVDGIWEAWSEWTSCTVTCGNGTRWRQRTCNQPLYGGAPCDGDTNHTEECFQEYCKVDGFWREWMTWGDCSASCDNGTRVRQRECVRPLYGGAPCMGDAEQSEHCYVVGCPVDGVWMEWSDWSNCSESCGSGTRWRQRECIPPLHGGAQCGGSANQTDDCQIVECPVDGYWLEWSEWTDCSVTCDSGERWRHRTCEPPLYGGAICLGNENETKTCDMEACRAPGFWATWSDWGLCSVTCGGGIRTRSRQCEDEEGSPLDPDTGCDGVGQEDVPCHQFECTPILRTCNEWLDKGLEDSTLVEVDPSEAGTPIWAKCNLTAEGGIGITEISHDSEARTRVSGYEVAGEFVMHVTYNTSLQNILTIIDHSEWCRQFIQWECVSAVIKNPHDPDDAMTFWANRDGTRRYYWGGADPSSSSCACYEDKSCANPDKHCNCDANDKELREDSGYVEEKADLPITEFYAGDTGNPPEEGFVTVGKLFCYGVGEPVDTAYDNNYGDLFG